MSEYAFSLIAQLLEALGMDYEPITYTGDSDTYFVGSWSEVASVSEDGQTENTFFLTGFTRSSWLSLIQVKDRVEQYFTRQGRSFVSDWGSVAWICYNTATPVPKDDIELKSLEINLTIKEWKVN